MSGKEHRETPMGSEAIETSLARFWMGEDGIIRIFVQPADSTRHHGAEESLSALAKLCRGRKHPVLADIRNARAPSREERLAYASAEEIKLVGALALVVESQLSRIIASFFLGINKLPCPTQVFTCEEKATQWLHGYVEEDRGSKEP